MTDAITNAIHYALNGLSDRQNVISNNIANVQTPGFIAGKTDFESALTAAMHGKKHISANPLHQTSLAPTNTNGNNVDIDNETLTGQKTELQYQTMIAAMNSKFKQIRSAIQ
jgi:flagellar basal-body rod protein FlgB